MTEENRSSRTVARGGRRGRPRSECPRCGSEGSITVKNGYIYFRHYFDGRERWCYVGPVNGYTYVSQIHDIVIDNIMREDYVDMAVDALEKFESMAEDGRMAVTSSRREKLRTLIEIAERLINMKSEDVEKLRALVGIGREYVDASRENRPDSKAILARFYELYRDMLDSCREAKIRATLRQLKPRDGDPRVIEEWVKRVESELRDYLE